MVNQQSFPSLDMGFLDKYFPDITNAYFEKYERGQWGLKAEVFQYNKNLKVLEEGKLNIFVANVVPHQRLV